MQAIHLEIKTESVLEKVRNFIRTLPQNEITMQVKKQTKPPKTKRLNAVRLSTKSLSFDREAAHER
jgi:hypothetical protein